MKANPLLQEIQRERELQSRLRDEIWEKQMVQTIQKKARKRERNIQLLSAAVLLLVLSTGLFFWENLRYEDQLYGNVYQAMLEPAYSDF
ncbi:MAG: hypothetical protein HS115_15035 [Spirochaetales bacterium]|nr:hypothetical protein [Spirochaetales bacterium]